VRRSALGAPRIAFRGEEPFREAWVVGTGLDVWELIEMLRDDGSMEPLAEAHENVSRRALELSEAYHESYPDEIDRKTAENRTPFSDLRELHPFAGFTLVGEDD